MPERYQTVEIVFESTRFAKREKKVKPPAVEVPLITPEWMADMKARHAADYAERIANLGPLPF